MIGVPSVRVQSRVPGHEEKSLVVIGFETNDLDFPKVLVAEMVDMALQLWSFDQNLPLPFCAPQFGCNELLFGHNAQNYTVCN